MEEKINAQVSVKDLVEYTCRTGDIDSTYISSKRMLQGTKAHQHLQSLYKSGDLYEVSLCETFERENVLLKVQGRADGILFEEGKVIINEIKSTFISLEEIDDALASHKLQALCYGYLYALLNNLNAFTLRITYYNLDVKKEKSLDYEYTFEEAKETFFDLTDKYIYWLKFIFDLKRKSIESLNSLSFPFEYRKYQRKILTLLYHKMLKGENVFLSAPTGSGKTIDALFAFLKAMEKQEDLKGFYLTGKSTHKALAQDTLLFLCERGLKIKSLTLTAKEKICFLDKPSCNPQDCPYAKGHFDRVNEALKEILSYEDIITRQKVEDYAKRFTVCPFEFSLDISLWCDIVICDYNYVFDPSAALKRFFETEGEKSPYILMVDEAHNLLDRSREMYSKELSKKKILELRRLFSENKTGLYKKLSDMNKELLKIKKSKEDFFTALEKDFLLSLYAFQSYTDRWLTKNQGHKYYPLIFDFYFEVLSFIKIYEIKGASHVSFFDDKTDCLILYCLDAQEYLRNRLMSLQSAVFFSATLNPLSYYCELLGGGRSDNLLEVEPIFPRENMKIFSDSSVSTRYKDRENNFGKIAEVLKSIRKSVGGNYMVFFPSYEFMERVYEIYTESGEYTALLQRAHMNEEEREEFVSSFEEQSGITGFCVTGGVFAEGINLVGSSLIGAVIVGVSLPRVNKKQEMTKSYFDSKGKNGFEYTYLYPGLNKVCQAGGRVIRTDEDKGFLYLLDERFSEKGYLKALPKYWLESIGIKGDDTFEKEIKGFFKESN